MVFGSVKKMLGGKKKEPMEEYPMRPILDTRPQPMPGNLGIPRVEDIPGMPAPPEIPEPPSFPPLAEQAYPPPTEIGVALPPEIESRRRQRIDSFRRTRGYEEPQQPQYQPAPQPAPQMVQRAPKTIETALGSIMDHLDRIEQRVMDVDRRLAMLESASRLR